MEGMNERCWNGGKADRKERGRRRGKREAGVSGLLAGGLSGQRARRSSKRPKLVRGWLISKGGACKEEQGTETRGITWQPKRSEGSRTLGEGERRRVRVSRGIVAA